MARPRRRNPETDAAAFLGDELTRARQNAGFATVQAFADHLRLHRAVISKAETGERPPSPPVLGEWIQACSLDDPDHWMRLGILARRAEGPIPRWFESWLAAEAEASILRYWSPLIIPALFHTTAYARLLFLATQTDTSDETIGSLVAARMARASIIDRTDPPEIVAVIDEPVLYRLVGSPEIMREQLEHFAAMGEKPYISVHVVPVDVGATAGLSGAVNLATVDGASDVLHTDGTPDGYTTEANTTETAARVRAALVAFERVRQYALPQAQSQLLITKVVKERWT